MVQIINNSFYFLFYFLLVWAPKVREHNLFEKLVPSQFTIQL